MRRTSPGLLIFLGILVILLFWGCSSYNGLVKSDEEVKQSWGNVQSAYQRRADLIPNLVETVKGETSFERGTLNDVINARARATSVNVNPENLTPEAIQQFQQAQGQLGSALGRLLVTVEQYPNLRANDAFRDLQRQLEGTENRINTARDRFNEVVNPYNTKVRSFPTNLFAGMFGFKPRPPFEAEAGAQNAPKVNFGTGGNAPSVNLDSTRR
jgi:LemA protein